MDEQKLTLCCPIRGELRTSGRSADGLTPNEEYLRVQAIKYLLDLGYPKVNFKIEVVMKKFGRDGRNSFRADFAVLNVPIGTIKKGDVDELLEHAILLCEVKKDNSRFDYVKETQVRPMLDFTSLEKCIGLYWDNVIKRIFWHEWIKGKKTIMDGSLTLLPPYGKKVSVKPICFEDTKPPESMIDIFSRIEDILHQVSIDPEQRYEVILQLLLIKLYDEHSHQYNPTKPLEIQDFSVLGVDDTSALDSMNQLLKRTVTYYQMHLPKKISAEFKIPNHIIPLMMKILAPVRVIAAKREVIQTFYMKFAKDLYRWDLAQYFTPITVTDFIVEVLNPRFGEHIKDPACGSADFLTAAFHRGREKYERYADCVWGVDNSANAVQIAVLNMLLNGDGKSNIKQEDSLENISQYLDKYDILVCNPPFGQRIVEKRKKVLALYDLGYVWDINDQRVPKRTSKILDKQETGTLFLEACVKQTKPGGRIGIILPNGYLGNRSIKFYVLRDWLMRHCKIVSICSFPRFTFKTSGADVSASVVFLEKRRIVIENARISEEYSFNVELIEKVGWDVGNKRAQPVFQRNSEDGSYIIAADGEKILEADFDRISWDIRNSPVANSFPWLKLNNRDKVDDTGWHIPIRAITSDPYLTLDPKRYSKKVTILLQQLQKKKHFRLGDIVDIIPEKLNVSGKKVRIISSKEYNHVELQDIGRGEFTWEPKKGWELPDRARHFAEPGDIYVGCIWGSVSKWCVVGTEHNNIVITNGCYRLRIKDGKEKYLVDFLTFLSTEAYATQLRALARGSDGLAEICEEDLKKVIIAEIDNKETRKELAPFVENLLRGRVSLNATVASLMNGGKLQVPIPPKRFNHAVLV